MRGTPYFIRLQFGLLKPKKKILGADIAGIVESVGKGITQFEVGDEVFGSVFNKDSTRLGGLAEYACALQSYTVKKPTNVTFESAAAVPVAGLTAYAALQQFAAAKSGDKVLVNGASGGVGTFAIQLAKIFGTEVTGVCSSKNVQLVQSIGADHVIDYTREILTKRNEKYDIIVDNVGNYTVKQLAQMLTSGGTCAIVGYGGFWPMVRQSLASPRVSKKSGKKIGILSLRTGQEDLQFLADQLEAEHLKPVISKSFTLQDSSKAIEILETGHAVGKLVITL
jgi:NADPH:quinone reductase-like Zn-dependent oxidoreductase